MAKSNQAGPYVVLDYRDVITLDTDPQLLVVKEATIKEWCALNPNDATPPTYDNQTFRVYQDAVFVAKTLIEDTIAWRRSNPHSLQEGP